METLIEEATVLAKKLAESDCCRAYREAKQAVLADDALLQRLSVYKEKHLAQQAAKIKGLDAPEQEKELAALYWDLMLDDRARRFLESEREAAATTAAICGLFTEACAVDPAFPLKA